LIQFSWTNFGSLPKCFRIWTHLFDSHNHWPLNVFGAHSSHRSIIAPTCANLSPWGMSSSHP
jgi:hypothetical protein